MTADAHAREEIGSSGADVAFAGFHTQAGGLGSTAHHLSCHERRTHEEGRNAQAVAKCTAGADEVGRAVSMSEAEEEEFNSAAFWRAPIGPLPELPSEPAPAPALAPAEASATVAPREKREQDREQEALLREQAQKLEKFTMPMKAADMTTEQVKETLLRFQAHWFSRHGRPVALSDARDGRLPRPVMELYDELGKRLSPEQLAHDQQRAQAKAEAMKAQQAQREAQQQQEQQQRAAAQAARAQEWEVFEKNKDAAWKSAAAEAKDQREEVAGAGALALTGAASWVKLDDNKSTGTTREEYLEQVRADFGLASHSGGQDRE
jgi:hypothetical protein